MTTLELQHVAEILNRIKDPDKHVEKAIAYVNKDLAQYAARRGQLREQYETDERPW